MAGKLNFSLVAPEREVFHGLVDQVDAPGVEGEFGVLEGHAPFMSTVKTGALSIYKSAGAAPETLHIEGGFAEVNERGLTVLAEKAG